MYVIDSLYFYNIRIVSNMHRQCWHHKDATSHIKRKTHPNVIIIYLPYKNPKMANCFEILKIDVSNIVQLAHTEASYLTKETRSLFPGAKRIREVRPRPNLFKTRDDSNPQLTDCIRRPSLTLGDTVGYIGHRMNLLLTAS